MQIPLPIIAFLGKKKKCQLRHGIDLVAANFVSTGEKLVFGGTKKFSVVQTNLMLYLDKHIRRQEIIHYIQW